MAVLERARRPQAPREAGMPRFIGKRIHHFWWELAALIVLVLVILVVLDLTGTAHIFS
jgi:hypothetical protein